MLFWVRFWRKIYPKSRIRRLGARKIFPQPKKRVRTVFLDALSNETTLGSKLECVGIFQSSKGGQTRIEKRGSDLRGFTAHPQFGKLCLFFNKCFKRNSRREPSSLTHFAARLTHFAHFARGERAKFAKCVRRDAKCVRRLATSEEFRNHKTLLQIYYNICILCIYICIYIINI